jgi:hypothetical protein
MLSRMLRKDAELLQAGGCIIRQDTATPYHVTCTTNAATTTISTAIHAANGSWRRRELSVGR